MNLKKAKGVSKQGGRMRIAGTDVTFDPNALKQALGTSDEDFAKGFLTQLGNVGSQGPKLDADGMAFVLSIVSGIQPRDQIEAMLGAQMAAIHNATMTMSRRLALVDNIAQQDSATRALNNLARTFAMQIEALKRYRSNGQQKVVVEHVTVNEGGQAIVGNVSKGGHGNE